MKFFVLVNELPFKNHDREGVTAVNIIEYALLESLVKQGHEIALQIIYNRYHTRSALTDTETQEIEDLKRFGFEVFPPIFPHQYIPSDALGKRLIRRLRRGVTGTKMSDFYPSVALSDLVGERISASQATGIVTFWCPEGLAVTHHCSLPKVAYHGDVDFIPGKMRVKDYELFFPMNPSLVGRFARWFYKKRAASYHQAFEQAHLELMQNVDCIANVTASNASYYTNHGHTGSTYIPNTWYDPGLDEIPQRNKTQSDSKIKIIGHMGFLDKTGSSYGLRFLLQKLMPALEKSLSGLDYEVHIIGGGEVVSGLEPWLDQKHIVMPGYVQDLDAELKSGDVFLMLNNAGSYKAAYTRHMVAWSMGLCLIAHADSQKAIPEVKHGENALLGSTPMEIADMIKQAVTDRDLALRIRQGGRTTYERYFTPDIVAKSLFTQMEALINS